MERTALALSSTSELPLIFGDTSRTTVWRPPVRRMTRKPPNAMGCGCISGSPCCRAGCGFEYNPFHVFAGTCRADSSATRSVCGDDRGSRFIHSERRYGEARRRLHLAAPELRGWEWHYLTRQSDPASRVLTAGGDVRRVTATADGRIVAIVPDPQNPSTDKNQDVDARNWRALTWNDTGANPVRSTKPVVSDNTRSTPVSLSPDGNLLMTSDEVFVKEGAGITFRSAFQRIYDLTSGQAITELAIPRLSELASALRPPGACGGR